ncbi:MAG: ABC transporter permease [Acidobacteriota bacterium]
MMGSTRQALRQLSRRPRATVASIALLTLGVALATSFYSLLDSALLSGLPFPEGDRMVVFSTREGPGWPMPLEDYRTIAEEQRSFEWTLPMRTFNVMLTRDRATKGVIGSYVPAELFERLGIKPHIGQLFAPGDEDPTNPPVALISHRLWHGSYGADSDIVGETIVLNREPTTVIGVLPPGFNFPGRQDVWGVLRTQGRSWSDGFVFGFAKLARGATVESAQSELARLVELLDESRPEAQERNNAVAPFVRSQVGDRTSDALRAMVLAALGLLLLTSANLANLRLGETLRRQDELDTRLALGAGRMGIARLMIMESLLLGLVGALGALLLTWLLAETLAPALLEGNQLARMFWVDPMPDLRIALGALGVTCLAALAGSLLPMSAALARPERRISSTTNRVSNRRWSRSLVSAQIGLCFSLLVAAGLFAAQARELLGNGLGFEAEDLSSVLLSTYQAEVDDPKDREELFERLRLGFEDHPEIESASFASSAPWAYATEFPVWKGEIVDREIALRARRFDVSNNFFETVGLPLLTGEAVQGTAGEQESTTSENLSSAVVSESLAQRLFGGDALGKTMTIGGYRVGDEVTRVRIVGVAANLGVGRTDHAHRDLAVYLPGFDSGYALLRLRPGIATARPAVEEVLSQLAPRVGTLEEISVEEGLSARIWAERRLSQVMTLFGVAALLLTAAGMFAVISVMVTQREHELGIRSAVGARPRDLQALVLGESGRQLFLGLCGGSLALLTIARAAQGFSDAAPTLRVLPIAGAAVLVLVVCLLGTWAPTRRASRTDPTTALRRNG